MEKALIIIPDSNKSKYITKGFSSAFRELSFFVIEKKLIDLNTEEINKISPHIIFIYWSGITQLDNINNLIDNYFIKETFFIHCADYAKDIPDKYKSMDNHYAFTNDSKTKKHRLIPAISSKEYKTKFKGYKYNITFSGNPAQETRELILSKIIYNFGSINIFCRSYDFYKSVDDIYSKNMLNEYFLELYKQSYKGYVESQKELAEIYSSTKINIDIENTKPKFINYRTLEVLASGGFLISQYNDNIVKYFDDGKELETFKTPDELNDKISFYLRNLNIAQMISAKGRKNIVSNFSFYDRLKTILKVIYGKDISSR